MKAGNEKEEQVSQNLFLFLCRTPLSHDLWGSGVRSFIEILIILRLLRQLLLPGDPLPFPQQPEHLPTGRGWTG